MSKCIDEKGHKYIFIGYMVVAERLQEEEKAKTTTKTYTTQYQTGSYSPSTWYTSSGGSTIPYWPVLEVPSYFTAKIEVYQCSKCGNVKLAPAVFSRL